MLAGCRYRAAAVQQRGGGFKLAGSTEDSTLIERITAVTLRLPKGTVTRAPGLAALDNPRREVVSASQRGGDRAAPDRRFDGVFAVFGSRSARRAGFVPVY